MLLASFHLLEEALQWYQWYEQSQPNVQWEEFTRALCIRFGPSKAMLVDRRKRYDQKLNYFDPLPCFMPQAWPDCGKINYKECGMQFSLQHLPNFPNHNHLHTTLLYDQHQHQSNLPYHLQLGCDLQPIQHLRNSLGLKCKLEGKRGCVTTMMRDSALGIDARSSKYLF